MNLDLVPFKIEMLQMFQSREHIVRYFGKIVITQVDNLKNCKLTNGVSASFCRTLRIFYNN